MNPPATDASTTPTTGPDGTKHSYVGQSLPRREDLRLLTGRGTFIDDLPVAATALSVAIVRSPHAHARVNAVDLEHCLAAPGVIAGLTGADVAARSDPFQAGVIPDLGYYAMAVDRARYVGEPVAAVVAEDRYLAEDAAALAQVAYAPLTPAASIDDAMAENAPILHESMDSNIVSDRHLRYGEPEEAFASADLVVSDSLTWERYSSTPIETYGVVADYDPASGQLALWANFMGPMTLLTLVARSLRMPEDHLRLIVPRDIGGSFGIKCAIFPYLTLVGLLAMQTHRPVKWIEDRAEHLVASSHQPDRHGTRELALRRDGTILGMRARIVDNLGAYVRAPEPATTFRPLGNFVGGYLTENVAIEFIDVLSNRVPSGPNRGYGCQQIYLEQERVLDVAASELGLDPAELRRRNLIPADRFPYHAPTGGLYDSGDYPKSFETALHNAGYDELRKMQHQARAEGRLVGIGLATAVDPSVSNMGYVTVALPPERRAKADYLPKSGAMDWAQVRLDQRGKVIVTMGTMPQGQGHETTVAQIVADELGIAPEQVSTVDEFDSHISMWGVSSGTYSSRFASVATSAVNRATTVIKDKVLRIAAYLLEAPISDLELAAGRVTVRGTDQGVSLKRIAGTAHWNPADLPEGMDAGIQASEVFSFEHAGPPTADDRINSSHTYGFIAEVMAVELDPHTWRPTILKYVSVHDAGTLINPKLVEGQVYGGALHGLGGILTEEMRYDQSGYPLARSFFDYRCLTAPEAPTIDIDHLESPSPYTALGSKGAGESSSETAPAVMANAVADAVAPLDVRPTEFPLTPARLWRLAHTGRRPS
jgi:2-furoyl-CoA dehydrogenase large subunit